MNDRISFFMDEIMQKKVVQKELQFSDDRRLARTTIALWSVAVVLGIAIVVDAVYHAGQESHTHLTIGGLLITAVLAYMSVLSTKEWWRMRRRRCR